ncbi:MAG: retrotransposon gag domain-containing protein, partial [Terracidiphilus sp.]|nr:retrotransposon gag domain-containing protein [Terracidiphilus sp.]
MLAQMEAMQRLLREQAHQLQQLRGSPQASPTHSPQPSPQQAPPTPASLAPQSRFARKEPRAQDLREYDGASGAKLDEWLQELQLATFLYKLNTVEASSFGVSRMRGAALQWWLALTAAQQDALTDPTALAAALRARFQPVTAARVAREQLDHLQQGNRSVNDYIADFQRLRTQLPSMAEEDALHAFERGLRRDLAEKLRVQGVSSVQEAIAMAARIGGLMQAGSSHVGRSAHAHQMEIDDGDGAATSLDDRITKAVLNAMQAQQGGMSGMGAKTQTHRGYANERAGAPNYKHYLTYLLMCILYSLYARVRYTCIGRLVYAHSHWTVRECRPAP